MHNYDLQARRSAWHSANIADPGNGITPMMVYPACSSSENDMDDSDPWGRVVFHILLALNGSDSWPYLCGLIARLHFDDDGDLHVIARQGPVPQDIASHVVRAYGTLFNNPRKTANVHWHLVDYPSPTLRKVWRAKKFEAELDPMGGPNIVKAARR